MSFKKWLFLTESEQNQRIAFKDVKFNTIDKYFADLNTAHSTIHDIDSIEIGDKIADYVMSNVPYWTVKDIDVDKNIVYLEPIAPNPYAPNAEGKIVGAGGHEFDQHDFDVLDGTNERERIDQILTVIQNKEYNDIHDVAYILAGTIPVHVGPNGSQGGWYNAGDRHNRGMTKGLSAQEVMQQDALTLKNKLGFSIPQSAINGTMDVHRWSEFVNGDTFGKYAHESKLDEEDFEDINKIAKIILTHKQPQIRVRNFEILWDKINDDPSLLNKAKEIALKLSEQKTVNKYGFDPYWSVKEKFIGMARQNKWKDVIDAFSDAPDASNKRSVSYAYRTLKDLNGLYKMLTQENNSEALAGILADIYGTAKESVPQDEWKEIPFGDSASDGMIIKSVKDGKLKTFVEKLMPFISYIQNNEKKLRQIADSHDYYKVEANNMIKKFLSFA